MASNTPQLWDKLWINPISIEEDLFKLAQEEHTIRWQRMEHIILREFRTFEGLRVIEIGAGAGTNAALMAKRGAQVTILDYSDAALKRAQEFFARNGLTATMLCQNALALPPEMLERFDIAISFGLTEHFRGKYNVVDVDGVRVNFGDGWALVRASNTQPVLVVRIEAKTPEKLAEIKGIVGKQLRRHDSLKNVDLNQ